MTLPTGDDWVKLVAWWPMPGIGAMLIVMLYDGRVMTIPYILK